MGRQKNAYVVIQTVLPPVERGILYNHVASADDGSCPVQLSAG